jgi:hypothetical protein
MTGFVAMLHHEPYRSIFMRLRPLALATMLAFVGGCSKRQVEVRTAPAQATGLSIQVKNTLSQAVNVWITQNGVETFFAKVDPNTSPITPVQGISAGTTVSLKAVLVDGSRTYSRANVVLNGTYVFAVP